MAVHLVRQGGERRAIRKYGHGGFTIGAASIVGSVLILPDAAKAWPVGQFADLSFEVFSDILSIKHQIDLCLIGCGAKVERLPLGLKTQLKEAGLHVELMDTGAACRTFNVLTAEGRALAAGLIAI